MFMFECFDYIYIVRHITGVVWNQYHVKIVYNKYLFIFIYAHTYI